MALECADCSECERPKWLRYGRCDVPGNSRRVITTSLALERRPLMMSLAGFSKMRKVRIDAGRRMLAIKAPYHRGGWPLDTFSQTLSTNTVKNSACSMYKE